MMGLARARRMNMGDPSFLFSFGYISFGFLLMFVKCDFFQYTFQLSPICDDTVYGTVISNSSNVVSEVECATVCCSESTCLSFAYNYVTGTCFTNDATFDTSSISNCTMYAQYGERLGVSPCLEGASCTTPKNNVRLCEGGGPGICNATQGRVEVFVNGAWGTICDDFWFDDDYPYYDIGNNNADVICIALGFTSGNPRMRGSFAIGTGDRWLDNVNCTGTENSIIDCTHRGIGVSNCNHGEDVGVECT